MNFNTRAVSRITGLTPRKIDYWDKTHFIKPSIKEAAGYGSARLYSFEDLIRLKVAKTLMDRGISLQKIRKTLAYLKKNMPDVGHPLSDLKFLTDGESVFVLTENSQEIIDALNGQVVIAVSLGNIIDELKGEVNVLNQKKYEVTVFKKKYTVILHMEGEAGGYRVECSEFPDCASRGDTLEEALDMIQCAIKECLGDSFQKEEMADVS
jgi:DNA-binding transcriptional MerR regulator